MSCTIGRSRTFGLKPAGCDVACSTSAGAAYCSIADHEAAVLLADRAAAAVDVKQRDAVVLPVDLRVVAARAVRSDPASAASFTVCPGIDSSRANTWLTSGFDAGSDESYTIRPRLPSTSSIQRPNASAMPMPGA